MSYIKVLTAFALPFPKESTRRSWKVGDLNELSLIRQVGKPVKSQLINLLGFGDEVRGQFLLAPLAIVDDDASAVAAVLLSLWDCRALQGGRLAIMNEGAYRQFPQMDLVIGGTLLSTGRTVLGSQLLLANTELLAAGNLRVPYLEVKESSPGLDCFEDVRFTLRIKVV